jgi:hypothetical protein
MLTACDAAKHAEQLQADNNWPNAAEALFKLENINVNHVFFRKSMAKGSK